MSKIIVEAELNLEGNRIFIELDPKIIIKNIKFSRLSIGTEPEEIQVCIKTNKIKLLGIPVTFHVLKV